MGTRAIIHFCDSQVDSGTIVLTSDGYPSFARDTVLAKLAKLVATNPTPCDIFDVIQLFQTALADAHDLDIWSDNEDVATEALKRLTPCFIYYSDIAAAYDAYGDADFHYTVHFVQGKLYY